MLSSRRIGAHSILSGLLLFVSLLACGCGMELETGYKYRALSATPAQRRAYYASPYSPEKSAASQGPQGGSPFHAGGAAPGS
jgi:hypothetical protein